MNLDNTERTKKYNKKQQKNTVFKKTYDNIGLNYS